jgi:hypothetical protein
MTALGGSLYAVSEGGLWEFDGSTATKLGDVEPGPYADIVATNQTVAVVSGDVYHVWDGTSVLTPTTGALTSVRGLAYFGGYHVLIGASGGREDGFAASDLDDPTTINALQFAFAESDPDRLVSVIRDHNELWLMGSQTVEVWTNVGGTFPFQRVEGGIQERGCLRGTVVKEDNAVFWVAPDGIVYRSDGVVPAKVSTQEVSAQIAAGDVDRAFLYEDRGHKFYVVRMRNRPALAYDMMTSRWVEFSTGVGESEFAATDTARLGNTLYVGTETGGLCVQEGFEDEGEVLTAECITPPISMGDRDIRVSRVSLLMDTGDTGPGTVVMQRSEDGRTWSQSRQRPIPAVGTYSKAIRWNGLKAANRMQLRFRVTDPVGRDIMGIEYE